MILFPKILKIELIEGLQRFIFEILACIKMVHNYNVIYKNNNLPSSSPFWILTTWIVIKCHHLFYCGSGDHLDLLHYKGLFSYSTVQVPNFGKKTILDTCNRKISCSMLTWEHVEKIQECLLYGLQDMSFWIHKIIILALRKPA